ARREQLRRDWTRLLDDGTPAARPKVSESNKQRVGDVTVGRITLEVEPGGVVALLLLLPPRKPDARPPGVGGVSQPGKKGVLRPRSEVIGALRRGGAGVCLPDWRGTGEPRPTGDLRGPPAGLFTTVERNSAGTFLACGELMLGQTLLGSRLRDLRSV